MKEPDILDRIRQTLKHPCNIALLDLLCAYKTRRKVSVDGRPHLKLVGNTERETMLLTLNPAKKRAVPDKRLLCSAEMQEFYDAFDGLRERSGYFYPRSKVRSVEDVLDPEDFPGLRKHKDRPIVFAAPNGDQLFQAADGSFKWAVASESKVKKVADSFSGMLKKYVAYRAIGDGHPFDSYGR